MLFKFTPQRSDALLAVTVNGDVLTVNGRVYDFSPLSAEGAITIGQEFSDAVVRTTGGELVISMAFPYAAGTTVDVSKVHEITVESGVVEVPGQTAQQPATTTPASIDWTTVVYPKPAPTQFELDAQRYQRRAAAKDGLIAYMAADNMSRVRAGVWTVLDLVALSNDPDVAALLNDVNTLSFELAVQRLPTISNVMLTSKIKADWAGRLTDHFYLVP